jgi:4-hydroxy-tetrahydrodipicolinate reductase
MKIALLGYGKMGHEIEAIALERGHELVLRIGHENLSELTAEALCLADVAIEFSQPEAAPANIRCCANLQLPVVVGTTGWYAEYDQIATEVIAKGGALLAATNFSIGVQLFFAMNAWLAKLMHPQKAYQVRIEETHHIHKKDAPSGTAITLAERMLTGLTDKKGWSLSPKSDELQVIAHRIDEVPGTHEVYYTSEVDEIRLTHTAFNRKGFALGAVIAAEWLQGKKGVYTMQDVIGQ